MIPHRLPAIFVLAMLLAVLLTGCAGRTLTPTIPLNPVADLNSLTSAVSLSIKAGSQGMSGRGYLIMRPPDQFRLMILSPFGTTLAEMFLAGDQLLYLASSQNQAYQGPLADLPAAPALQSWRLLSWTIERVRPEVPGQQHLHRQRADGQWENIDFDQQGLVLKKRSDGDEVRYEEYQSVAGVPVPTTIRITDRAGISVQITLVDPEVNTTLDEKAFVPSLEGFTIHPLRQFPTS
jgi:outer membrane lipoprotein-sorting protein